MNTASPIPILSLKETKEASVLRRHRWVFSGALKSIAVQPAPGQWVWLENSKHNILGSGFYGRGSIAIRLVGFDKILPEVSVFADLFKKASAYRRQLSSLQTQDCTAVRRFHGEGDGIPGLILDSYQNHFVLQGHHEGIDRYLDVIIEAIQQVYAPDTLYYQPVWQGQEAQNRFLWGNTESCIVQEYGIQMEVNWCSGQKTGTFIDQREHRKLAARLAQGKQVLNAYAYSGGFSLACLKGGAEHVTSLDISSGAMQLLENNLKLNGIEEQKHTGITTDVPPWLRQQEQDFDLVILDPPAFAKKRNSRHQAIQAYRRLNALGFKRVKSGGFLMTFSCSGVVDEGMFRQAVFAGALDAGVRVRVVEKLGQPGDHPVDLFHSEASYLKGLLLYVEK